MDQNLPLLRLFKKVIKRVPEGLVKGTLQIGWSTGSFFAMNFSVFFEERDTVLIGKFWYICWLGRGERVPHIF